MSRASTKRRTTAAKRRSDLPPTMTQEASSPVRVMAAILLPLAIALLVAFLTGLAADPQPLSATGYAPLFAALGVASWFIGISWYRIAGMALRGRRPLFAGIGFATLGWVALLLARLLPNLPTVTINEAGQAVVTARLLVEVVAIGADNAGRLFVYLLLFEAFALQLWTFGLVFRALADWRGALTAAVGSGLLFSAVGFLLFREAFTSDWSSLLFFVLWGVLYGLIRLRTGSLLGIVLIQALQSFTVWYVFLPPERPPLAGLQLVYLIASLLYALIIWRLWPRQEGDYRI